MSQNDSKYTTTLKRKPIRANKNFNNWHCRRSREGQSKQMYRNYFKKKFIRLQIGSQHFSQFSLKKAFSYFVWHKSIDKIINTMPSDEAGTFWLPKNYLLVGLPVYFSQHNASYCTS